MLILVAVTVTVAIQGGLFRTAKDAAERTKKEAEAERNMYQAEFYMAKANGETDAENFTDYMLETKYGGVKIGDYVDYNPTKDKNGNTIAPTYTPDANKGAGVSGTKNNETGKYDITTGEFTTDNLGWRVLGVNDSGELELVSDNTTNEKIYLANQEGYLNSVDILNEICNSLYGKGTYAKSARSLNLDDVNDLAGFNPSTYNGYGTEYTYSKEEDGYIYRDGVKQSFPPPATTFSYYNEQTKEWDSLETGKSKVIKSTDYTNSDNLTNIQWIISDGKNSQTYLANRIIRCNPDNIDYRIAMYESYPTYLGINNGPSYIPLIDSKGNVNGKSMYIRPVVTLKSDITITKDTTHDGSTLAKACTISE